MIDSNKREAIWSKCFARFATPSTLTKMFRYAASQRFASCQAECDQLDRYRGQTAIRTTNLTFSATEDFN
jgi:hypothetical protein